MLPCRVHNTSGVCVIDRRSLLGAAIGAASLTAADASRAPAWASDGQKTWDGIVAALAPPAGADPEILARNETHWRKIADAYDVTGEIVNLENGYWGLMARPVMERYLAHTREVNRANSYFARRDYAEAYSAAQAKLAEALGAGEDEIAITRGATEALKGLISGYKGLKPGDGILISDLDYGSIQASMDWLADRHGADLVRIDIPEPASHGDLIDVYARALTDNPQVRLMLLTHVSHRTGLVMPVREIVAEARRRGVDVIVDAAHSWGQIDFRIEDLGADFVGFNLHKWIGAPLGAGLLYIRRERLKDIAPDMASGPWEKDRTSARVHTGTTDFATVLTVPAALELHRTIGPAFKEARLRHLRSIWVEGAQSISGLTVLTPDDPRLHAGITSFRFDGQVSVQANIAIAGRLLSDHGIFTVHRSGVAKGACIRVTPSLYTSAEDVRRLAPALQALSSSLPEDI